jgi:hypothetical protein
MGSAATHGHDDALLTRKPRKRHLFEHFSEITRNSAQDVEKLDRIPMRMTADKLLHY